MAHPIEVRSLCKAYGKKEILSNLTFQVPHGSVFGFLGRNGSGKTTTIGCLVGLLRRNRGEVSVLGADPEGDDEAVKARIGFVAESTALPPLASLDRIEALLRHLYPTWDGPYFAGLCRKLRIPRDRRMTKLSLGEQRKAAIAVALASRPEVLILDEPAANLEAVVRREFLEEVIDLLAGRGATVFVSSHILSDTERIADRIGILSQGKLLFEGEQDDLKDRVVWVRASFPSELLRRWEFPGPCGRNAPATRSGPQWKTFGKPPWRVCRRSPGCV